MNATERAEKVFVACMPWDKVNQIRLIAAELEAYAAERVSEAVCAEIERQRISWKQTCDQAVEEERKSMFTRMVENCEEVKAECAATHDGACKKCQRAHAFYCAECFEGEKQAAVDEESTLRTDWNYVIEELEAKVKSLEADCAERVRKAVEEDHPCYGTGYRTGIEDAAKIAQDESLRYAGKALLASDALADVAKAIRALAKEMQ